MPYKNPKGDAARNAANERHARWREKNRQVLRDRSEQFRRDNPGYHPEYFADHREDWRKRNASEVEKEKRRARYTRRKEEAAP